MIRYIVNEQLYFEKNILLWVAGLNSVLKIFSKSCCKQIAVTEALLFCLQYRAQTEQAEHDFQGPKSLEMLKEHSFQFKITSGISL